MLWSPGLRPDRIIKCKFRNPIKQNCFNFSPWGAKILSWSRLNKRTSCVWDVGVLTAGQGIQRISTCHTEVILVWFLVFVPASDCQGVDHLWHESEVIIVQMIKNTGVSCTRLNGCGLFDLFSFWAGTQADWHCWPYPPVLPESWLEMRGACKWALLANHRVACSCEPSLITFPRSWCVS